MRVALRSACLSLPFALSMIASAEPISPYPDPGTLAPAERYTATQTGTVTAYFAQGGALTGGHELYTDLLQMDDITSGVITEFALNSQTSHTGDTLTLNGVDAGDQLVFKIEVENLNEIFASQPSLSADDFNHAYASTFSGGLVNGTQLPAGLLIGMEDTDLLKNDNPGNLDYADLSVVVTGVAAQPLSPVPEPSSLLLLATGALSAGAGLRRRREV